MDWMTLTITLVCGAIFVCFIVVPVGEFREIFHAIRTRRDREGLSKNGSSRTEGDAR